MVFQCVLHSVSVCFTIVFQCFASMFQYVNHCFGVFYHCFSQQFNLCFGVFYHCVSVLCMHVCIDEDGEVSSQTSHTANSELLRLSDGPVHYRSHQRGPQGIHG